MENICLNILIIDDEKSKVESIQEYILSINPNIAFVVARSQIAALTLLEKVKFDLVLLDMCLPLREGEELEESGGKNILDELDINDIYIAPSLIVALTQFDELQEDVRNKFPELGAIKYSNEQSDWQGGLRRIVNTSVKSKEVKRSIIYCEDQNDSFYNGIGLENVEFRGLKGGSRKVYEYAKFEKQNFAVRDKDYITRNEVKWLTSKFKNYLILDYYCFENYLFHPDNMEEYFNQTGGDFDKSAYIVRITAQKNSKLLHIVQGLQVARNGYFDFTDNQKSNMDSEPEVIDCLKSDDFETFYPYFDMKGTDKKKGFDRSFLTNLNVDKRKLASTQWFSNKMRIFFSKVLK